VVERAGSRIAPATGGAGERGSRFCRAQQKSALSRSLRTAKLGVPLVLVRGPLRHGTMGSLRREIGGERCIRRAADPARISRAESGCVAHPANGFNRPRRRSRGVKKTPTVRNLLFQWPLQSLFHIADPDRCPESAAATRRALSSSAFSALRRCQVSSPLGRDLRKPRYRYRGRDVGDHFAGGFMRCCACHSHMAALAPRS